MQPPSVLPHLYTKASAAIVIAAFALLALMIGVKAGLGWTALVVVLLTGAAGGLGWRLWTVTRQTQNSSRHARQLRFIADRFHALVRTLPGGYCLFSPQGLLREELGAAKRLGVKKIGHFDDLIAAIKEGPQLTEAFRRMQRTGEGFSLQIRPLAKNKDLLITGQRFRIGREGPHADVLWFNDILKAAGDAPPAEPASQGEEETSYLLQPMLDVLPFPVWTRANDLRLVMCNKAYAKAMDASIEDVLREQHELMSQTARGGSGRALAANALGRKEAQNERRHVIIAGKRRLIEITEMPFRLAAKDKQKDSDNAPALFGFAVDVTTEEEKDTALQRHMAAQHEVMEHLGSAIAIYGGDQRLEFYNRAYQRLWEAEESFLDGKPTFGEVLEDLRTRRRLPDQADFQRYKKERLSLFTSLLEPQEDLMYLPDGTSLRILAIPHPFGGIMFVHENVTDRLALESSYNTLMAVQKETLDNLAEGIAVFGPDGKLRLSNPAFARIWKVEPEFLATEPHVADLLEPMKELFNYGTDWEAYKSEAVGYTLDRNPRSGRIERTDQTIISYQTVPLPDGAVLNSYLDVTDSVHVEQALRARNAALATADRLKSDFVANVSYQLRTPLNTITGFAEILAEQYFGTLNEKQLEYTHTIKAETEKLSRLINDVLDLAIIEAGRMALDRKPVAVADLLNAAKQMTAEWARQQSLEITIDCPSDLGRFDVDENRMKQVLFNLIGNAIKYTPPGGRIALVAQKQDAWVILSVLDTGIGIPEADRDRVFGKFERANVQARQGGAGLGLSLVKSFVELHGGRIEIFSDAKQGTRVSCYIPTKAPPENKDT